MEYLSGWRDLVSWGEQAGVLEPRTAAAIRAEARARSRTADRTFTRAVALRETVYRIFHAVAAGKTPASADLELLNDELARALPHARVMRSAEGWAWGWSDGKASLEQVIWPVVRSAADLIVSPARVDVRECASTTCSWLFIDHSRRRSRRWCSMKTCGNRDKVRRFYERRRAEERGEDAGD